uniref:Uncharacterized protein n=1 Tax=viral metagenome TaxID=1070528 RepID=A0A6M3XG93_9ZZZZ
MAGRVGQPNRAYGPGSRLETKKPSTPSGAEFGVEGCKAVARKADGK